MVNSLCTLSRYSGASGTLYLKLIKKNLIIYVEKGELMKCAECHIELDDKDFINKQTCYRCIYRKKIENPIKVRKCRVCDVNLPTTRWKFCSNICSDIYKKERMKNYWTRVIVQQNVVFIKYGKGQSPDGD